MQLAYNGIIFPYPNVIRYSQRPVRDDSDTDWGCTEFDIQAQFTIHANYLPIMAPELADAWGDGNAPASNITRYLRERLYQHRKALSLSIMGQEQIPHVDGNEGTVDSMNGPKVMACEMQYLSETSWLLTFHVTTWYWEQTEGLQNLTNEPGNNVLYNRWSETVDIDDLGYSTRTRSGKYVIRSDNDEGIIADEVRANMAIVGIPPGFLRTGSNYTVDPSGLGISYTVTDREYFRPPPSPAFKAQGQAAYIFTGPGGIPHRSVSLTLSAGKNVSQAQLISTAMAVAGSKMNLVVNEVVVGGGLAVIQQVDVGDVISVPSSVQIVVSLYENVVSVEMSGLAQGADAGVAGRFQTTGGVNPDGMATAPYPPGTQGLPAYLDRGSAGLLLHAAAYWDPNLRNAQLQVGAQFTANNQPTPQGIGQLFAGRYMTPGLQPGQAGQQEE